MHDCPGHTRRLVRCPQEDELRAVRRVQEFQITACRLLLIVLSICTHIEKEIEEKITLTRFDGRKTRTI